MKIQRIERQTQSMMESLTSIHEPELVDLALELPSEIKQCRRQLDTSLTSDTIEDIEYEVRVLDKKIQALCYHQDSFFEERKTRLLSNLKQFLEEYEYFRVLYGFAVNIADPDFLHIAVDENNALHALTQSERLEHIYILGSSGCGKSKLLESLIIQDLLMGRGGTFIDPFGTLFQEISAFCLLYEDVRSWLGRIQQEVRNFLHFNDTDMTVLGERFSIVGVNYEKLCTLQDIANADLEECFPPLNVKCIDFTEEGSDSSPNPYRINPFQLGDHDTIESLVDCLMRSVERFTGQSTNETPQLATILEAVFTYMIVEEKTLADLLDILDMFINSYEGRGSSKLPASVLTQLRDDPSLTATMAEWSIRFLLSFPKNEFIRNIHSTANRQRLFNNAVISNFLSTPVTTLNLYDEINTTDKNGKQSFLLFNLSSDDAKSGLVATYLLTRIDKIIFKRKAHQKKLPYTLYIDEFHRFVDDALAEKFAETRQFGLGYCITHQTHAQLAKDDHDKIKRDIIFADTHTKIIFQCSEEAEYIVRNCFPVSGTLEKITTSVSQTSGTSGSTQESTSHSTTTNETIANSTSTTHSSETSGGNNWNDSTGNTTGENRAWSRGDGVSYKEFPFHSRYNDATRSRNSMESRSNMQSQTSSHASGGNEGWSNGTSDTTGQTLTVFIRQSMNILGNFLPRVLLLNLELIFTHIGVQ